MILSATAPNKKTILVVDDIPDNLALIRGLLAGTYRTQVALSAEVGLRLAGSEDPPDLILLDVMMPGMGGYEACRLLRAGASTASIPVIFLISKMEVEAEAEARSLVAGAVDCITKPISPPILLARIRTHLELKAARDFFVDKAKYLEHEVERRTVEVGMIQHVTMLAMGSLAETRDIDTGKHIRRTQSYVKELALILADNPRLERGLSGDEIVTLFKSAPLHDIGKIGIPDSILLKPGRYTPDESAIMKRHTTIGRDAILRAENLLGAQQPFLKTAREIVLSHHERWDGTGYPEGLIGEAIPIAARLMSVADVYDALVTRRVYKEPIRHEEAVEIIGQGRGSQFDADVVDAFQKSAELFREIAESLKDAS